MYPVNVRHAPNSRFWRTPHQMRHARSGQEDATPNIQDYAICDIILVFTVLPFVFFDICRTEDHKPRGRASDVSTISTCFFFLS